MGALAYGLPDGHLGDFAVFAGFVFLVVLVFVWLPGVLVLFALQLIWRAYRRVRA
jgi:hypothetical protein